MENLFMSPVSHVEFRPMFDYGDHCVVSAFADAEYFGVYYAPPGRPASRDGVFANAADALWHLLSSPTFSAARRWYNGNEMMREISSGEDILMIMAEINNCEEELLEIAEQLGLDTARARGLLRNC